MNVRTQVLTWNNRKYKSRIILAGEMTQELSKMLKISLTKHEK